jgi:hypothetical protein
LPPLSLKEFFVKVIEGSEKHHPPRDMIDWIGPSIDQKLAESGIVTQQAVIRQAVQPKSIVI